jgi:hypothetical protein
MHSYAIPLHLGEGTSGHAEEIWQRRSRGTWCAWIQVVDGGRLLVFVNAHREIHKCMDTDVAFNQEYSSVSYLSTRKQL